MNYSQTLAFLSRRGNEVSGIHLGLHRIAVMLEALGNPHLKPAVLHIAGTNGKGSVAAMADSILRRAGWKTGLYTSPHLEMPEERIRLNGRNIPARSFAAVATKVREQEELLVGRGVLDLPLTYFEFITACAFYYFSKQRADVAVVEVGLGGLLDATNVVRPEACIITGVALDHQDLLGPTVRMIAGEKAGIIKAGIPAVSGCRRGEARRIVREKARSVGAPLLEIDRDCKIRIIRERGGHFTFDLRSPMRFYGGLRLSLAGRYQVRNAALAVLGVEALRRFPARAADIRYGLATAYWPGRLDERNAGRRTLLDAAHNPEGAKALKEHLLECGKREIHLVFGALGDKDFRGMGRLLFPLAKSIHLTPVANPRSAEPSVIASGFPRFGARLRMHRDAREALRAAWRECPRAGLVVVTGSIYMLGEILPLVRSVERRGAGVKRRLSESRFESRDSKLAGPGRG